MLQHDKYKVTILIMKITSWKQTSNNPESRIPRIKNSGLLCLPNFDGLSNFHFVFISHFIYPQFTLIISITIASINLER